jgi:creatinine amidohydrolase
MMSRDADLRRVQAEYLLPDELDAAVQAHPVVYLPLGSLEFHSAHLPIGLDALNAHGLCVRAAASAGGIVLPPVYQGVGGGHVAYPWTIMMTSDSELCSHLDQTLARLEEFGFRVAVLFTGHFADEQLAMIDKVAEHWRRSPDHTMDVLATGVNRCEASPIPPDHAGVFETSLLFSLWPDRVHVDRLASVAEHPSVDPGGNPTGNHRHDPSHPLWGIFGPDPRGFDTTQAGRLRDMLVTWLARSANNRLEALKDIDGPIRATGARRPGRP